MSSYNIYSCEPETCGKSSSLSVHKVTELLLHIAATAATYCKAMRECIVKRTHSHSMSDDKRKAPSFFQRKKEKRLMMEMVRERSLNSMGTQERQKLQQLSLKLLQKVYAHL